MATIARPRGAAVQVKATDTSGKRVLDVVCYARDLRVAGRLEGPGGWLSGRVEQDAEIVIRDATVRTLAGEPPTLVSRVVLPANEVAIVEADGWPGLGELLWVTLNREILIEAGPYLVRGRVRGLPGTDPVVRFRDGRPAVTMRDAIVSYPLGDVVRHRLVREILVNRVLVESVTPETNEAGDRSRPRGPVWQRLRP
jgi:hypothetical protein